MIGLALLLQTAGAAAGAVGGGVAVDSGGARGATVGDTLWVARTIAIAPRQTVRPVDWKPEDPVEVVGRPRVIVHGATVEVQYPLTVWRAGRHRVEIPGPLVLGASGAADSLPPQVVTLDIKSVLPSAPPDSSILPQPRAGVVPRRTTTPVPLAIVLALAGFFLVPLRMRWWRRGKPVATVPRAAPSATIPIERWVDAGERRAVASFAAARLRMALERRATAAATAGAIELAPSITAELNEVLGALDLTRFGSTSEDDTLALLRRTAEIEARLVREAP